jgi:hypothetical protein
MAVINRGQVYVAAKSFVVWDEGRMIRFRRGRTTIREGHPLLAEREDRFQPFAVTHEYEPPKATKATPATPAKPIDETDKD